MPPERAEDLVTGHGPARLAMDALASGWLWSRLARFDERSWVEIVAWRERAAFERVFALATTTPEIAAWFDLADPGFTLDLGDPLEGDAARPPPAQGYLELVSARPEEGGATAPGNGTGWSLLLELGDHSWMDDVPREVPRSLLRINALVAPRQASSPSGEVAAITHSFDAPRKPAAPA